MSRIEEAIDILRDLGMPRAQQNERSGLTLLALLDVGLRRPWSSAKKRRIRIHDIMRFIDESYDRKYAENTRETIRRQTLHQFEQAGIAARNPDDPSRPTNSPNNVYEITEDALEAVRKYGTLAWTRQVRRFQRRRGTLVERYDKRIQEAKMNVNLPGGQSVRLSPGEHNILQKDIIEKFVPRFVPGARVLYVGDTANKMLHVNRGMLAKIGFPMTQHDKLPDVVIYEKKKNILILAEAVTSHGPISPKRHLELEKLLRVCKVQRIYS